MELVEVVVVSFQTPILIGVYRNRQLTEEHRFSGKVSEVLPPFFSQLLSREQVGGLYYSRGPGSLVGVRLTYLFLKTLSIVKQIPLYGVDSFYFTNSQPVKGPGRSFFVKKEGIITVSRAEVERGVPQLPKLLRPEEFEVGAEPLYLISPV